MRRVAKTRGSFQPTSPTSADLDVCACTCHLPILGSVSFRACDARGRRGTGDAAALLRSVVAAKRYSRGQLVRQACASQ